MRKILLLGVWAIILSLFSPPLLSAQETQSLSPPQIVPPGVRIDPNPDDPSLMYPPDYPPPSMPTGLYELALFDKKGGVQVAGKIILDELDKESLNAFSFVIPGKDVVLTGIVDEKWVYKKTCIDKYPFNKYSPPLPGDGYKLESTAQTVPGTTGTIAPVDMPQYCPPQYTQVFTTVNPGVENISNGIKVSLTIPPKSDKTQESLLFLYRTNSYTNHILSTYFYHFDTVRLPIPVNSVQIGILVRDGLNLRGTSGINYTGGYIPSLRAIEKAKNLFEEENQDLVTLSNEIAYQGYLRKGDSDMPPDTSMTVSGVYGTNGVLLYIKEIAIGLVVFLGILGVVLWGIKRFYPNHLQIKVILLTVVVTLLLGAFLFAFFYLLLHFFRTMGMGVYSTQ